MSPNRPAVFTASPVAAFAAAVPAAEARLRAGLLGAAFLGVVAVSSLPAARAVGAFGWMPLWLIGMPLCSLFVLSLLRRHRPDSSPARMAAQPACVPAARRWPSARPGKAGPRLAPAAVRRTARPRSAALVAQGPRPGLMPRA